MDMLSLERARYVALRERLLADVPEIDERTLADTLEGITDYQEMLVAGVRAALRDEAQAVALQLIIDENLQRLKRFEDRAQKMRGIIRDEMEQSGVYKIAVPDFTASLRSGPPHVVVIDETKIPKTYFEDRPHLKKRVLLEDLKLGIPVEGASLSNPRMSLSVRTR